MLLGLLPDLLAVLSVIWRVDGVVNPNDDDQRPCEGYKDPIGIQRMDVMRFATSKRIVVRHGEDYR